MSGPLGPRARLLVVEDDPDDMVLIRRFLAHAPGDWGPVVHVTTLRAARHALRQESFELILLDYRLPDGEGEALLHWIVDEGCPTPVVVLTGVGEEELVSELIRAGATDYLPKRSLTEERLLASLRYDLGTRGGRPGATEGPAREEVEAHDSVLVEALTPREAEVLSRLAEGLTATEIGERLQISARTVETHKAHLLQKLGARNSVDLIRRAVELGLL